MAGSSVRRPFWHRFHSEIVPEGMRALQKNKKTHQNEVPEASGVSFLRSQGDVLRSPVPCCMRWALRATSGSAPEASRGRSRGARGALGSLRGRPGHPPTATFWGSEATLETLCENAWKMGALSAVLASIFRRFGVDSLLASVLVSVALESLRGKTTPSNLMTLTTDDGKRRPADWSCVE